MSEAGQITKVIDAQLARIRVALKDRVLTKVADATGLHVNTIRSIAKNEEQLLAFDHQEAVGVPLPE